MLGAGQFVGSIRQCKESTNEHLNMNDSRIELWINECRNGRHDRGASNR